ncbi:MAG: N-acetylglucosamine-6-phosphate deacetylase [Sciscionella sp.]
MPELLLASGKVVARDGVLDPGWLTISGGIITAIGGGTPPQRPAAVRVDVPGCHIVPGFIDIHCHGGGGGDYSDPDPERVRTAAMTHRRGGTTTALASLVSRPIPELVDQVAALTELVDDGVFAGIHLEGPFISHARRGAHDPDVLRPPEAEVIAKLLAAGRGTVKMITIAPELDGGLDAIRQLTDAGVLVAIGHTDATEEQILPAIDAGARVATHLFNAMRPLHHREPGAVGALLADERITIELICDLVHVAPTALRIAARYAGIDRTALVTDAMAATGMSGGTYRIGKLVATVIDGAPRLPDGTIAASTLTMGGAFGNFVHHTGGSLTEAAAAAATRPARLLGLAEGTGALAEGLTADLVVLDTDLRVARVLRRGEWIT